MAKSSLLLLTLFLLVLTTSASHHYHQSSPAASSHHHHHSSLAASAAAADLHQSLLFLDPSLSSHSPPPPPPLPVPNLFTTTTNNPETIQSLQLLAHILTSLGFHEMARSAPLLANSPVLSSWSGPITVFAPTDSSLLACGSACSGQSHLFLDHIAPGLFPLTYLATVPSNTKFATATPGHCLTITTTTTTTSTSPDYYSPSPAPKLYVTGAEITGGDLYNDGYRLVIHGVQGFVAPLPSSSCLPSPPVSSTRSEAAVASASAASDSGVAGAVVRVMLRDAIRRLRDNGYSFVALALRFKYPQLERLANMTVFALDDGVVFAGGGAGLGYVSDVMYHVVPNHLLTHADLLQLPSGTLLPTLGAGHSLMITDGIGAGPGVVRVNFVPIKAPNAVVNSRIAVHGVYVPLPHLLSADSDVATASPTKSAAAVNFTWEDEVEFAKSSASPGVAAAAGSGSGVPKHDGL